MFIVVCLIIITGILLIIWTNENTGMKLIASGLVLYIITRLLIKLKKFIHKELTEEIDKIITENSVEEICK
jgi:uncharacterized membrane protein